MSARRVLLDLGAIERSATRRELAARAAVERAIVARFQAPAGDDAPSFLAPAVADTGALALSPCCSRPSRRIIRRDEDGRVLEIGVRCSGCGADRLQHDAAEE